MWNANIHYHELLRSVLPAQARRVMDVGCGDGILSAELARSGIHDVVAVDSDPGVLERAKRRHPEVAVDWRLADILAPSLADNGEFDAVLSIATLHHMDAEQGLARFAQLVRPGGVVGVVGLAAPEWFDVPYEIMATGSRWAMGLLRGNWQHSAPVVWPPPVTYRQMREIAARALPGVRYERLLLGRYLLVWKKPV